MQEKLEKIILTLVINTEAASCNSQFISVMIVVFPIKTSSIWTIIIVSIVSISTNWATSTVFSNHPSCTIPVPYSFRAFFVIRFSIDIVTLLIIISINIAQLSIDIIFCRVIYFYLPATRSWNIFEFEKKTSNSSKMLHKNTEWAKYTPIRFKR